jgi:hypothetical protein
MEVFSQPGVIPERQERKLPIVVHISPKTGEPVTVTMQTDPVGVTTLVGSDGKSIDPSALTTGALTETGHQEVQRPIVARISSKTGEPYIVTLQTDPEGVTTFVGSDGKTFDPTAVPVCETDKTADQQELTAVKFIEPSGEGGTPPSVLIQAGNDGNGRVGSGDPSASGQTVATSIVTNNSSAFQSLPAPSTVEMKPEGEISSEEGLNQTQVDPDGKEQ